MRIDIWSDIVCPFCYIGEKRLQSVAEETGVELELVWHSFQLDPNAPRTHQGPSIRLLVEKYGLPLAEAEAQQRKVAAMAKAAGVDYQWQKTQPGNTFDAHRVLQLAQTKGLGTEATEAFFEASLTEGLRIGEPEVIEEVAVRAGLDRDEVRAVLQSDRFTEEVRADQELGRRLGASGVPFLVFDNKFAISGAQSREVFADLLHKAQAERGVQDGPACDAKGC